MPIIDRDQLQPSRVYVARTVRVDSINSLTADIEMDFGIHVHRQLTIEGVIARDIVPRHRPMAFKCLVLLIGGKRLIVRVSDNKPRQDGTLLARLFLNEHVRGDPVGMATPLGVDQELLEVGTFYRWLSEDGFDDRKVTALFRGGNGGGKGRGADG